MPIPPLTNDQLTAPARFLYAIYKAVVSASTATQTKTSEESETKIYRYGNGNGTNMTPRKKM